MSGKLHHRGIFYSVTDLDGQRWKWQISPPDAILGLRSESGEALGRDNAVVAAQKAIEAQTRFLDS